MAFFDPQKAREQYLERLLARYGTVTLPLDAARHTLPLHTVFQPLVLRHDPLAPQDEQSAVAADVVRARDGAEALAKSEHRRMVVLGGPGMGKTTALKALLCTAITKAQGDPTAPLPLFISLPDLMRAGLSFAVYSQHLSAELAIDPRFAHILLAAVHDGNAFLCLDSLDEVLPALRPEVIAFLNTEVPRCRGTWIIGSRFTEYKGGQFAHSRFAEWELQSLDKQQRLTLARQLLPAFYDAFYRDVTPTLKPALPSAEAYIAELQQNAQIAPWGENPLLLSLAAVFYTQTGSLLQHSDEHIRAQALAVLTQRHVTLPAHILLPMLEHSVTGNAAVQAIAALGADAPISSLVEMVWSRSPTSAQFASQALRVLYQHVPTAPILALLQDEEIINAYGGTYWELIRLLQLRGVEVSLELLLPMLKQRVSETTIAPIIVSLCHVGAQAPIEALIRVIFAETRGTAFYPKCIQQLFHILYEWVLPGNLAHALGNTPNDQWLAVSLLGLVHDDESMQLISAVAQDPSRDRTTRSEAMVVLSDLGVNLPLEYLLQATRWCIYEGMGEYVVNTVKRLGKQTPLEQLLPLLGEDHNRLQSGVVKALAGIADYIPLETVLALLEDPHKPVRHAAIRLLGALGERAPLPVFMGLLSDPEQTLETRCHVLSALGELGTPAAVDLLLQALEDREVQIRSSALWALKDNDPETRRGGIRAFKEHGKEIPLEPLLKLLNDPDATVVMSAISVLAELGSLGVAIPVAPLVSLLDHKDAHIVGEAAEALCTSGERAPVATLLMHMDSADEPVSEAIFYALSSLGAYTPLEAMLTALSESENSAMGWRMKYALGNLAESLPEQILQRLHDDPRPAMRRVVLQAIQATRAGEWLPLVLATLHDADGRYAAHDHSCSESADTIRATAIQTLGALNACAPIEPLLQLLNTNKEEHSYNDERIVVLEALKQFGSRVPLAVLWPLLGSNHAEICRLAFQHLQESYPAVLQELVPMLKAIVRGEPVQGAFAARMDYRLAETVALLGRATSAVLETVIALLDHPFWEVRSRAARTLGTLCCPIPDRAIQRLLELRKDPESLTVRADADQALAELLALEQGMEDE